MKRDTAINSADLEDANQASPHLFITPCNEIAMESAFQDTGRLIGFSVQSILYSGNDCEVISALEIDKLIYSSVHHQTLKMVGARCTISHFYQFQG